MSAFAGTAASLANLLLAVHCPFPLHISEMDWHDRLPLRAALALAPQLQAAQANRAEDVYMTILLPSSVAKALHGRFAPESLYHNLSEQQLLCSLSVLACANPGLVSKEDKQYFQDALRAIRDRLGYAFFESAIHACVGHAQVSQEATIRKCVSCVYNYFPDDILSLAQRYGDLIIRLHGALPFLQMLDDWCWSARQAHVSQEAFVEVFDSPLTRAAAMILGHWKLSPIPSQEAVEAAFDALSLAERARLLLVPNCYFYNEHASSVERKLHLLGFDPSIQTVVRTSSDEDEFELLLRCLLHTPDPSPAHVVLEQACKQSWSARYTLRTLSYKALRSDEARMRLAQVLINAPGVLHRVAVGSAVVKDNIRQLARSLPDASLRVALQAHLALHEQIYNLSEHCVNAVKKLITNRFGAQLDRLQDAAGIATVYNAMLQDQAWLGVVDETVADILGYHSLMSAMYGISSEPTQGI